MSTETQSTDAESTDTGSTDAQVVQEAVATAAARGVETADGVLRADTHVAGESGEGSTTPEHLMAAALAACLRQAVAIAASTQEVDAGAVEVTATVTLTSGVEAGYTSSFALAVSGLPEGVAQQVLDQATTLCPFTKALAGADLTVSLAG